MKKREVIMAPFFENIPQNRKYGYARISPRENVGNPSLEAQKIELIDFGVPKENIYFERESFKTAIENGPIFLKLINKILKKGDLLAIATLDHGISCRNILEFLKLLEQFHQKGVIFISLDVPYSNDIISNKLTLLLAFANSENKKRKERQLEKSKTAKKNKKYRGRKSFINKDLIKTVEKYKDLGVSVTEISRITGKSRSTIYKVLKNELGYISNRLVKNNR